jgi:hypothetical protein
MYRSAAYHSAAMLFAASLVLTATGAMAQGSRSPSPGTTGQGSSQGTPAERAACQSDVRRFCRAAGNDSMQVLYCLQEHGQRLSRACRGVLQRNGQL